MSSYPSSFNGLSGFGRSSGSKLCRMGGALAVCVFAQVANAQQTEAGPGRSPFLPQGWEQQAQTATVRPVASEAAEGSYVFNGMIQIGSRTLYSIGNTQTGHAMLLEIGDTSGAVQVLSYDAQRNSVSLSGGGRTEELSLRKSDGEPLVAAAPAAQGGQRGPGGTQGRPQGQGGQNATGQNRGSGPPIGWLEARRDRMNEMIERRRAEEAAAGGGTSGAVTVGGGANAPAANNANRASGSTMQDGAPSQGSESGQGVRGRRLRVQMNP